MPDDLDDWHSWVEWLEDADEVLAEEMGLVSVEYRHSREYVGRRERTAFNMWQAARAEWMREHGYSDEEVWPPESLLDWPSNFPRLHGGREV